MEERKRCYAFILSRTPHDIDNNIINSNMESESHTSFLSRKDREFGGI
jgi:hypothetical protein